MSARSRIWVQLAGAGLLAFLAVAQATGLMRSNFDSAIWIGALALAAVYMLFEAWRTWRKAKTEKKET